jgi:hypothetical protein
MNTMTFHDEKGCALILGGITFAIIHPKRAALAIAKDVMMKDRTLFLSNYNDKFTIYLQDGFKMVNTSINKPYHWDEFLKEYNRAIKMKAFM